MSKLVIGIDCGHSLSGAGTGAVGIVKEVDKNREVGKRLITMLQEKGHTVVNCTVDSASSTKEQLAGIVRKANAQTLDVFCSLHLNSFDTEAHGVEVYIYNGNWNGKEANRTIAKKVQDKLVSKVGWYNRGVKEANYQVLRETVAPAILCELGFCDNKKDMDLWNTEKIAMAIFEGLTGAAYQSSSKPVTKELYRIRKTWADASSQKGAYSNLNSAIAECNKYIGYSVFNSAGVKVYPVVSATCDHEIKRYAENGKFTTTVDSIYFRDKPCTCHGVIQESYYKGESVYYDLVVITEKYVWISWIGGNGARRYMPITDRKTNEKWGVCV